MGGATKQNKLQTLPPVLCLHLKRFTWRGTGARSKLDAHVDFPLHSLDLSPYINASPEVINGCRNEVSHSSGGARPATAQGPVPPTEERGARRACIPVGGPEV